MRLLLQEAIDIGGDHFLKVADQVFALRKDVGDDGANEHAGFGDEHWVAFEERILLPLENGWLKDLSVGGALEGKIDGTARKVGDECN